MIEVDSLTKRYGSTVAVQDLSFAVSAGRVTGFLGPNGAGKSTTMRAILGLVRPTSGTTTVLGSPYRELHPARESVGALAALRPESIVFGHGPSIIGGAAQHLEELDKTLA